jgi:hypothetical protein
MARRRKNPALSAPLLIGGGVLAAGAVWYFFFREREPETGLKYPGLIEGLRGGSPPQSLAGESVRRALSTRG